MNIKPIGKNILVEPLKKEETTKSGLIIETKGESRPEQGRVIDLAEDYKGFLKVKDKVIFKKYSPDEIQHEGELYLIMKEEDILAVIRDENN